MAGNRAGGIMTRDKNLAKDPDYYRKIGRIGGARSTGGGFTGRPDLARVAGAIGGARSRRKGPNKATLERRAREAAERELDEMIQGAVQQDITVIDFN